MLEFLADIYNKKNKKSDIDTQIRHFDCMNKKNIIVFLFGILREAQRNKFAIFKYDLQVR